jgi:Xaa-Pro dipeptidase
MTDTDVAPIGEVEYRARVRAAQAALAAQDLDGMLCLDHHDVLYLSGFFHAPSERPVGCFVPRAGDPVLFVPLLEREHAEEGWIADVASYEEYPGRAHPVAWMAEHCDAARLGVDALDLRVAAALADAGRPVVPCTAVERLRWRKSPAELALVEAAARFADRCLEHVLAHAGGIAARGGSELDILVTCLEATADDMRARLGPAFEGTPVAVVGTVHTGPRASLPHGRTGRRRPHPGDVLIAGIGARVGGYHAESGATFVFGRASPDQQRCLRAAEDCDRAARTACRPGTRGEDVNQAAWAVLHEAGLGGAIRHRIGHGMGVQGHESPWLAPGDATTIEPGMVFSSEPGIYRPGRDGYRTINTLLVTEDGPLVVSRFQADHPLAARVLAA